MYVANNFNCRGFGPLLEDKLCLIFKLAPSVCRMTFPILASLLVRLVVLLPFQLLRLSLMMSRKIILIKQELLLLVYELNRSGLLAENEKIRPILAQLEKLLLCDLSPSTNDSVKN